MIHTIEVWGDFACFTRPEFKIERVSYEIPTPAALRGILESILWKPQMKWEILSVEVLQPIRFLATKRNEVSCKMSSPFVAEQHRAQRSSLMLTNVRYRIEALIHSDHTKHDRMFIRRALRGQCHHRPYFGIREYTAFFNYGNSGNSAINETRDLGYILFDKDYKTMEPMLFNAKMINGKVTFPRLERLYDSTTRFIL